MKNFIYIFLLIPVFLNGQVVEADSQIVVMIDNNDSIYYYSSLNIGTLTTNHNSVKITPLIEANSEDDVMEILSLYKSTIDSIPDIGEWCTINIYYNYGAEVIKCLQSHYRMHFLPEETPALWLFRNPIDCSEWVQPSGGHDAYNIDDCVTFNGSEYISLIDANVWSPSVYPAGWKIK